MVAAAVLAMAACGGGHRDAPPVRVQPVVVVPPPTPTEPPEWPPIVDPTPTPTPTATPTPALEVASGAALTREQIDEVLRRAGWPPEEWERARAVAWCESRWRPDAVGAGGDSLGLFQLWAGWLRWAGFPDDAWADPVANATVALRVWETHGWEEWACQP